MTSKIGLSIQNTGDRSIEKPLSSVSFFNPGYEATLARGIEHYTPSKSVRQFREDCATLPLYLPDVQYTFIQTPEPVVLSRSGNTSTLKTANIQLCPWGWAPELRGLFPTCDIPYTTAEMCHWGSRLRSIELWLHVHQLSPASFEPRLQAPMVVTKENLPLDTTGSMWVVKSEFSSSGRGILFAENTTKALQAVIKKSGKSNDGCTIIEPWLQHVSDRGYEFRRSADGTITYLGGSDFHTHNGRYVGNRLISPQQLEREWTDEPTTPSHAEYVKLLTQALNFMNLGRYCGLLGVDTIVYRGTDGKLYLSPCIELNIRPTMGHIALELSRKYIGTNTGTFTIGYTSMLPKIITETPLYLSDHQPQSSGTYLLTPVSAHSRFVALLHID